MEQAADVFANVPKVGAEAGDATGRGAGLHPAGAELPRPCPAAKRSASNCPENWPSARPGAPSTCSTSPRPVCTSTTSLQLLTVLHRLRDGGNTVVVIRAQPGRHQDRRLDHRSGAGGRRSRRRLTGGGGPPEEVARVKRSHTGRYLAGMPAPPPGTEGVPPSKKRRLTNGLDQDFSFFARVNSSNRLCCASSRNNSTVFV